LPDAGGGGTENSKPMRRRIQVMLKVALTFALTAAFFLMVYQYDNKYTFQGPQARDGILVLDSDSLAAYPILFFVDGWEYYGGRLLTPGDFTANPPIPDQYMFIGRFGGFEKWNGGNPHGSASYRLNIRIPEEPAVYLLELPEIFSAYRLYLNGKLAVQMGEPEPEKYRFQTGNRSVSVEAGGSIEILFAVSDYSHLYSGIVYPPAFGRPEAVSKLLSARIIFRSLLCAAALTVGLLSVLVGLLTRRDALALPFGFLCFFFVGYAGYPIMRTLFAGVPVWYTIERVCFCAMLCVAMLIAMRVSGLPKKWEVPSVGFGGLVCVASAVLHLLLPLGNLGIMLTYSRLITAYEWIAAGFIAAAVWYAVRNGTARRAPLLYGVVTFVCSLMADRLLPLHEPILTGWFIELASFALVLWIGVATGQEVAARYRESAVLTERVHSMERLYQSQLSHFMTLRQEMDETKTLRHNMRHHLAILDEYVQNRQYGKLAAYMKEYHVVSIGGELPEYCPIDVINVLTHHYNTVAGRHGIHLDIRCDLKAAAEPALTGMSNADLCSLYSNLMENAVEACLRTQSDERLIRIAVFRTAQNVLNFRMWNSAEEVRQTGGRFLSSKQKGRRGYGLSSVETIASKYGGSAEFRWDAQKKEFESRVTVTA
jgi:hypothetical protein